MPKILDGSNQGTAPIKWGNCGDVRNERTMHVQMGARVDLEKSAGKW